MNAQHDCYECTSPRMRHLVYVTSCASPRVRHLVYVISCTSPRVRHLAYVTSCASPRVRHLVCVTSCASPRVRHLVYVISCTSPRVRHLVYVTSCTSPPAPLSLSLALSNNPLVFIISIGHRHQNSEGVNCVSNAKSLKKIKTEIFCQLKYFLKNKNP